MKRLLVVASLLLLFSSLWTYAQAAPPEQGQPTEDSFTLIEKAHRRGELSLEQKTFYRLYALFGDESLPARFHSKIPPREDGTMLMLRTLSVWPQLSEATRRAVVAYYTPVTPAPQAVSSPTPTPIPPPNLSGLSITLKVLRQNKVIPTVSFDALYPTAHFAVYYDSRPLLFPKLNANPNYASPDYAKTVGDALEDAWNKETGTPDADHLGFRAPPPTHSDGIRYEVYIVPLGNGRPGITPPTYAIDAPVGTSYMFIDNAQNPADLPQTVAHELNHASQYAYGGNAILLDSSSYWYMESTAQWVQFALFGDTPQWKSLVQDYLNFPENGLESYVFYPQDQAIYGTVLFPKYIQERFGRDIVRASWERVWNYRLYQTATMALHLALTDHASSLSATFTDFARANYLKHYPANEFAWSFTVPVVPETPSIGHPVAGQQSNQPKQRIGPLGAHYLAFSDTDLLPQLAAQSATDGAILNVHFEFKEFRDSWTMVKFYRVRDPNLPDAEEIPAGDIIGGGSTLDFKVAGFGKTYHQVVAVVDNASWDISSASLNYQPPLQYEYRAEIAPITVTVAPDRTGAYNKGDSATFTALVKDDYQRLFDPGKLSATLTSPSGTSAVSLTRAMTGTYTYRISYLAAGTHTLAVSATDGGKTGQGQASLTAERVLWLANGTPPGYYIPGYPIHWYVTYYQRDNVPPSYVRVYVTPCVGFYGTCQPQVYYTLQPQNPSDTNYTDGAQFVYDMPTDPTGQIVYYYHFEASDGTRTVYGEDPGIQPMGTTAAPSTRPADNALSPQP